MLEICREGRARLMERPPNLWRVDGFPVAPGKVSGVAGAGFDNVEAMAWLDRSLEYVRGEDLTRLKVLLEAVRTEVLFEMEIAGGEP